MASDFTIDGMGTAIPTHHISQSDAAVAAGRTSALSAEDSRKLAVLYRSAGVRSRGSVLLESSAIGEAHQSFYQPRRTPLDMGPTTAERMRRYESSASELAVEACRKAFGASGVNPSEITHLITVSCSGFSAPGVDAALIRLLGLSPEVSRTHVGFMGCHGALNGLRTAHAYASADPRAVVLLCAVELCSLHHDYGWNPERLVANALFADGAAAVVGRATSVAKPDAHRLIASGSCLIPHTEDMMSWRIGDNGFQMTLSSQVPDLIRDHLRPWLSKWLASHDLTMDAIKSWAIHPGGPRILTAVADAAGFDRQFLQVSQTVLAEHGNMSSPTVLFILNRMWSTGIQGPCVALAFGPGLAIESALFA